MARRIAWSARQVIVDTYYLDTTRFGSTWFGSTQLGSAKAQRHDIPPSCVPEFDT
ncbi:hypothetical protein Hanom_Chr04g00285761 [Helianthus anomalus]